MAKPRGTCKRYPDKICYEDKREAATALLKAKKMMDKGLPPPRRYDRCKKSDHPLACKMWHLTSWTREEYLSSRKKRARKGVMA